MVTKKPRIKCKFCGHVGQPKTVWRGSRGLNRFLWYTLLIPGPLYAFWRWQGRYDICPDCGSTNMVPSDSEEDIQRYEQLKKMEGEGDNF